jgi:hypothetical protein
MLPKPGGRKAPKNSWTKIHSKRLFISISEIIIPSSKYVMAFFIVKRTSPKNRVIDQTALSRLERHAVKIARCTLRDGALLPDPSIITTILENNFDVVNLLPMFHLKSKKMVIEPNQIHSVLF